MRNPLKLLVWSLALVLAVTPALASGNVNFVLGQRSVDTGEDDLEDIEDQPAFGVNVDFKTGDLPFSWVAGLHASSKSEESSLGGGVEADADVSLTELSFGVGWMWEVGKARPYVGGGVSFMSANIEVEFSVPGFDFEEDDQSPALYGDGGIYWRLGEAFNLGVGGRIVVGTDFDIEGESVEADYMQIHGVVGWSWD